MANTKIRLVNGRVIQANGEQLNLSGSTYIFGTLAYSASHNGPYGEKSIVPKDWVKNQINTGSTLIRIVTASTYNITHADNNYFIIFDRATAQTVNLPSGTSNTSFQNTKIGAGNVTFTTSNTTLRTIGGDNTLYTSTGGTSFQYDAIRNVWYGYGSLGTGSTSSGGGDITNAKFNAYTASTQTTLNGKLNTTSFNTYSGVTATRLLTLESQTITGGTNGITKTANRKARLGGTITGSTVFTDNRVTKSGLQYAANYTTGYTSLSLPHVGYVTGYTNSRLGGRNLDSTVTNPGAGQNLYVVTWHNASATYRLLPSSGTSSSSGVTNAAFATYTGTTAPNQFASRTIFNAYTASTTIDTVTGNSNYTVLSSDRNKIKRFTNTSQITVILPNGLNTGAHLSIVKAGSGNVVISAATTLNSSGTVLKIQYTGCDVYHRGSNAWEAYGALFGTSDPAYTPSNVTTDRSFDADTVVVAELADVVGTLIADLQAKNIIS